MATLVDREAAPVVHRTDRGVAVGVLACVLVAGVAVVDPWGFAPFGPAKVTVVTLGVLAAGAALGGRVVALDRGMGWCWLVLLGWLGMAAVVAPDVLHAWLGTPDRRLGWVSWVLFGVAWCCGRAVEDGRDLRLLLRAGALAVGALGVSAVAELAGLAPATGAFADGRVGGPYGQPAYLGAVGVLLTPVAIALAVDVREGWRWRAVGAAAAAVGVVAVLGSLTRAAWVGAAVACVPLAPRIWRGARRRPAGAALVLSGVVAISVLTPVSGRLVSLAALDGTAGGRLSEWRTAAAAVADAPVFGFGPEGYRIAFPRVVDAAYAREHGRDVVPDRAHNGVLDVTVSGGVPAGAAYLVLMILVSAAAWRSARGTDPLAVGLGVGILAYVVAQQFLFPFMEGDPLFWILAGALGAVGSRSSTAVRFPAALSGGLAVAAVVVLATGGLGVAADRLLQRAASASPADRTAALHAADRATALRPDSIRARYVAGRVAAAGPALTDLDAALDRLEGGLRLSPLDPALRTEHARLLLERSQRSGLSVDRIRAREALEVLVSEDPTHPAHRLRLAVALALAGELSAADAHLETAERLTPRSAAASIERARVALLRDDVAAARAALARARHRDPGHPRLPALAAEIGRR